MQIIHFMISVILLGCNLAIAETTLTSEQYQKINFTSASTVDLQLSISEKWMVLKTTSVEANQLQPDEVYKVKNEILLIDKRNNLYWGQGLDQKQFVKIIQLFKQKSYSKNNFYFWKFLNENAYALNSTCEQNTFQKNFEELNKGIQRVDFEQVISKCNYSITELFKKKIDELKETLFKIGQFNFSEFISTVKEAFNSLINIIPQISTKILQPLSEMIQTIPKVAENIICNFTENKIGDIFQAAIIGPAGFSKLAVKTAEDIGKLSHRIYVLTKNGMVSKYLIESHKGGKLTSEMLGAIENLISDIPDSFKRTANEFVNESSFKEHAIKHKKEFGFDNAQEYLEAAKKFTKSTNPNTVTRSRVSGGYIKWNTKTDEFVVISAEGKIVTYYKQSCDVDHEKLLVFLNDAGGKKSFCNQH